MRKSGYPVEFRRNVLDTRPVRRKTKRRHRRAWPRSAITPPIVRVTKTRPTIEQGLKRRSRVVGGIFPSASAMIRFVGAILIDMHDEWIAGDRRYLSEESMARLNNPWILV